MDRRLDPPGASTPTPEREDGNTRGSILLQQMGPMLMIPTALHEGEVPSSPSNEQLSRNTPDLHAETQSEVGNRGEREDHGTVAGRSSEAPSEHKSGGAHVGRDAPEAVKLGKSKGECHCYGTILARVDLC